MSEEGKARATAREFVGRMAQLSIHDGTVVVGNMLGMLLLAVRRTADGATAGDVEEAVIDLAHNFVESNETTGSLQ